MKFKESAIAIDTLKTGTLKIDNGLKKEEIPKAKSLVEEWDKEAVLEKFKKLC